jgi:lipopolysaccharide transport system ATP-binding protein
MIVDEVLAVGDAEFQKKCLGKMGDISRGEGRTILFVSHNLTAVQQLCQKGILFEKGVITNSDNIIKNVQYYLGKTYHDSKTMLVKSTTKHIKKVILKNSNNENSNCIFIKDDFSIEVELFCDYSIENPALSVGITSLNGDRVATLNTGIQQNNFWGFIGYKKIVFCIKKIMINQGIYELEVNLWDGNNELEQLLGCLQFEILPSDIYGTGKLPSIEQGNYLIDVKINIH